MDLASAQGLLERYWTELLIYCAIGLIAGTLIGVLRGRVLRGAVYGLLLGPIGWWLAWRWEYVGNPCPECGGLNSPWARVCCHCKVDLRKAAERSNRSRVHSTSDGWR
jgi:hypothetical protein